MRSNYKMLGSYIRKVDIRNRNLQVDDLRGISMTKEFRKSTSNIVGTDMSRYKIVEPGKFACDFMSVIRVHKLPVVLNTEENAVIVSPAYTVFEVIDENKLLPEYLMMWFRRSEFDRYADFRCDSAIRGGFAWDELCEVELPIPSPVKQQEIVDEYNTVVNRIKLNEDLNQKLEETAQTLYRHWFVDFEFPISKEYAEAIGKPELEGQPYKSSGGEMVFNEELEQDIPSIWTVDYPIAFGEVITGKTPSSKNPEHFGEGLPFITPTDFKNYGKYALTAVREVSQTGENVLKNKVLPRESLLVTCIGSDMGKVVINDVDCITNQQINSIKLQNTFVVDFLYYFFKSQYTHLRNIATGSSTMLMINKTDFQKILLLKPDDYTLSSFHNRLKPVNEYLKKNYKLKVLLQGLQDLLLKKVMVEPSKVKKLPDYEIH